MDKRARFHIGIQGVVLLCWFVGVVSAQPQLAVELISDPTEIRNIMIGTSPKSISFVARATLAEVECAWSLNGAGTLEGDGLGALYTPPDALANASEAVVIRVTVTTPQGQSATASVTLHLLNPMPLPTVMPTATSARPTPSPTATKPKKTPVPKLTPTPKSVMLRPVFTPTPVTDHLEQLKLLLSESLTRYNAFIKQEKDGEDVARQILPVVENILTCLRELETIYIQSGDIRQLEQVRKARNLFEADRVKRTDQ